MLFTSWETELYHYGIKGQRWGVRRFQNEDGSLTRAGMTRYERKVDRMAKKDAKSYARAKMFYGEGAGNKRKLINAKVNARSKDPFYKQQFEKHLENQDMAQHAKAAQRMRHRRDAANVALGRIAYGSLGVVAAYTLLRNTGLGEKAAGFVKAKGSALYKEARYHAKTKMGRATVDDILRR